MEMMGTMMLKLRRTWGVTMYIDISFVKNATALGVCSGNVSTSGSGGRTITARYRMRRNNGIRVTCQHRLATIGVSAISSSFLLLSWFSSGFSSSFFLFLQLVQFLKLVHQYAVLFLGEVSGFELLFHLYRELSEKESGA